MNKVEKKKLDIRREMYEVSLGDEYKEKEAAYYELKNRLALYEIAKKNNKLAKLAKEAIEIREELGVNPKIVKLEKEIVDLNEKRSEEDWTTKKYILKWLFILANIIIVVGMSKETIDNFAHYCSTFMLVTLFNHCGDVSYTTRYRDDAKIESLLSEIKRSYDVEEKQHEQENVGGRAI